MIIKLETSTEDRFNDLLDRICQSAKKGNKKAQKYLSKKIWKEQWQTISLKLDVEGSVWYVWWIDGIHELMKDTKNNILCI